MRKRATALVTLGATAIFGLAGTAIAFAAQPNTSHSDRAGAAAIRTPETSPQRHELETPTTMGREEAARIALGFVDSGEYDSMTLRERGGHVVYWVNVLVRGKVQVIQVDPLTKKAVRSDEGAREQADYIDSVEHPTDITLDSPMPKADGLPDGMKVNIEQANWLALQHVGRGKLDLGGSTLTERGDKVRVWVRVGDVRHILWVSLATGKVQEAGTEKIRKQ